MNRARHRSTVESSTPRSAATCLFVAPSAQASTIFARHADRPRVPPPRQPTRGELAPPLRHRLNRHPQRLRRPRIRHPLSARQDDPCPVRPPDPRPPCPAHQLSPLTLRQHNRHSSRTRHNRRLAPSKQNPQYFRRDTLVPLQATFALLMLVGGSAMPMKCPSTGRTRTDHPSAVRSPVRVRASWNTFTMRYWLPSSSRR